MADRIRRTVHRVDRPQYLFRTYRNRWPDGTAECVEFYVRTQDGEMRRVYDDTDFEDETARNVEANVRASRRHGDTLRADNQRRRAIRRKGIEKYLNAVTQSTAIAYLSEVRNENGSWRVVP